MAKWVHVGAEAARRHPLYGIKGWLIVLAMALAISAAGNVYTLVQRPLPAHLNWSAPVTGLLLADMALTCLLMTGALLVFGLMLIKSRHFPRALQGAAFLGVGGNLGDMAFASILRGHGSAVDLFALLVPSMLFAAIWVPYATRSARVNVTFHHRVRG